MAQPALSQQILQLELELGQDLFHRHARGMELTAAGLRLRDRATEIIRQIDGAKDELTSSSTTPVGTVKLGMATAVTMALSVPLLRQTLTRYPRVRLHLVESMSGFLLTMAERGQVDLAIAYDIPGSAQLQIEDLGREDLLLIAGIAAAEEIGGSVRFRDLERLPLILPGFPHSLRHLVDAAAAKEAILLDIVAEVDSTYSIKKLVADGLGCSILSLHAVEREIRSGELVAIPIEGSRLHRKVQLGANLHRINDPAVRCMSRLIVECFGGCWDRR